MLMNNFWMEIRVSVGMNLGSLAYSIIHSTNDLFSVTAEKENGWKSFKK